MRLSPCFYYPFLLRHSGLLFYLYIMLLPAAVCVFITVFNRADLENCPEDAVPGAPVTVSRSPLGAGGTITATIATNKRAYAQWEDILLSLNVDNQTIQKIKRITAQLFMIPKEQRTSLLTGADKSKNAGICMHTWERMLFPYAYPKNRVANTVVLPLPDIRSKLPQTFTDNTTNCEISYELRITVDIPLARDVLVHIPIRILCSSPTRSLKVVDPLQLIPGGNAINWTPTQCSNWIRYKLGSEVMAKKFERFGFTGADFLMAEVQALTSFAKGQISSVSTIPEANCAEPEMQLVLREIALLNRRFTLPLRLLHALQLQSLVSKFNEEQIEADDLYGLTELALANKVPIGPRLRILRAISSLSSGNREENESVLLNTGKLTETAV
jgi:hypothetical protein